MDQTLTWWAHALLDGWQDRPGPRYARLAAAILDSVESGRLRPGTRLPAERVLAGALGVSRGTVVSCYDRLVDAGVLRRRQGAGTFVVGRPGWNRPPAENRAAALLLRRLAGADDIDLSLGVPEGTGHLPPVRLELAELDVRHQLEPAGLPGLREAVARHLSHRQGLPTEPSQVVITNGAQQALTLLAAALGRRHAAVVTGCPTYPGLSSAFGEAGVAVIGEADGPGGLEPQAVERAARAHGRPVLYLSPSGSNPAGRVMSLARRRGLLAAARAAGATVVEDLALADLHLGEEHPPPHLAVDDPEVVVVGSLSKLFWAGLRIGWVRAEEPLRSELVRLRAASDLASSSPSQAMATALLDGMTPEWLAGVRGALRVRRDHLVDVLAHRLPSWRIPHIPEAGLSLWVELPVRDADAFADRAASLGVAVAPGRVLCVCGGHGHFVRLSYAHPLTTLDLAVERLALAWEKHAADLAATPVA
ncbi:MAG TPA: PLP-dependent aminotransferase family protein [Candidatus Angelobacter sp.]|jgi:DNA-binding transcriptional MocR family regulator|nr:PLP-dependent aminotransferase family protein [Candidatus Angelobacter sp.]